MQRGHATIVAIEYGEKILGQIALVAQVKRADDTEVDRGVAWLRGVSQQHEDISRMHVGVKEVVAEDLREEDFNAVLRQAFEIGA